MHFIRVHTLAKRIEKKRENGWRHKDAGAGEGN